jgi:putative spermidine/putrescine transport system permease protein
VKPDRIANAGMWVWMLLVCVFILAPLAVLIAISFTADEYISLPWHGVGLRWYADMLNRSDFLEAARNSALLMVEAAATAVVLGTMVAIALTRYRFPGRGVIALIASAPMFVPLVMTGLAILIMFSNYNIGGPAVRLYVGHVALTVPYVIRLVSAATTGFDWNQEVAARNLGASSLRAFLEITLPQIAPGVIAGGVFALIVSFDDVGISIFLAGASYTTLPVELFAFASYSLTPMVASVSVVMILFSALSVVLIERLFGVQRMLSGGGERALRPQEEIANA